ncbi:MAG: acyl carrier protein [Gammaproteobacteria bacterium]|nr:acyl carrier protein [Gammaproteobacteria bacterium]MBU2056887.1 acyl carrier protein [Gammaproteobacteria bacterium]MBU2174581.1 acyl carrier protein [Gammaproteobacteria bacterium]MBU2248273.1 acyl carrier protein [Gammaproteobacteria bacterium]MBU2343722.1 acyl carrier protein [Gammaproteobacteria bacterium]
MSSNEVRKIIIEIFNSKEILKDIESCQDFFEVGASSLTVVDLQIQIEKALNKEVETSKLMANPTIDSWVNVYAER